MEEPIAAGDVRGFLHRPEAAGGDGLVLTHGAGSNSDARLIVAMARVFAAAGFVVLRCDLPFRQLRPTGPPFPAMAARDREGLRHAVEWLRPLAPGRVVLGGHSYGGRQASMLAASDSAVAAALLLLSYPLHPPRKPLELRTAHFSDLRTPALFVHGTRDPFGRIEEMEAHLPLIPAPTGLLPLQGDGHDLKNAPRHAGAIMARLQAILETAQNA